MLVELKGVTKNYKPSRDVMVKALDRIDFAVDKGDYIAILGVSGSGKTTLLNLMGLLDKATTGEILIEGEDVSKMGDRKLAFYRNSFVGFVLQDYGLISYKTVGENVMVPLYFSNQNPTTFKKKSWKLFQNWR